MLHHRARFVAGAVVCAATLIAAGCQTTDRTSTSSPPVAFGIVASSDELVVGETATFTSRESNTYGRDVKIEWGTTGGTLDTEQNGRVARVKFDRPGTYVVTATMHVEDEAVSSESVRVTVRPL
jgi:hypothetical protein